ncbi:hypothetical protein H2201_004246 [Coniosporium apollinis]|uniref:Cytochrome P450 n=2 Tax=Coniosporium TaxID=2810619 RepID=A0ABQ9NT28_9PEZI|nr:hypothetical protein H2199_000012 [Cladosporium sp. JES 115]KAJ9665555.1 hypothetical protein H2201_004246 [Coniosporium apollinis]
MPTRDAHKQFQKWAEEYGPVYSLILGTKTLIVLSSDQAVKDLLDKRSNIYSDRQDMYIGMTLCSGGLRVLMMRYGPVWRSVMENKQMLYELLKKPDQYLNSIRRYSNSLTTSMVFGWRSPQYENEDVKQLFEGFEQFSIINQTGTAALIDFFPILRRLPDWVLPTQKKAKELHEHEKRLYLKHWLNCKQAIKGGTAKPCFCVNLAKIQEAEGLSDDQAAYISGTLLEAGSDTTSSTLSGAVMAMVVFPEVEKRAQQEIDRVVGPNRLPTMDDEPNLQYIRGCVKESLRWMPTTILGAVPHAVTKDDEYMGYHIPAGAGVLNNVWAINMDPKRYPDPRRFDPDRYANDFLNASDAASNPDASKRDHFTFGAGRRICPGIHVAERSLFLGISRMLWAFNFEPAVDMAGKPIIPDIEKLTQGFVCMPEPFQVRIVPRSKERANMVIKEWEEAKQLLDPVSMQWRSVPDGMALPSLDKNLQD